MPVDRGGRRTPNRTGRLCTVCEHVSREKIEKAVVLKTKTWGQIEAQFRPVKRDAIHRHMRNHVSEERKKEILLEVKRERAAEVDAEINQDQIDISTGLQRIVRELDAILQRSKAAGDDNMALTALRDLRGTLMDLAKLYGKLREVSTVEVKILEAPQWIQLRAILVEVFQAHPAAGAMFVARTRHLRLLKPTGSDRG